MCFYFDVVSLLLLFFLVSKRLFGTVTVDLLLFSISKASIFLIVLTRALAFTFSWYCWACYSCNYLIFISFRVAVCALAGAFFIISRNNDWNLDEVEKDVCPPAIYNNIHKYKIPLLFFHFVLFLCNQKKNRQQYANVQTTYRIERKKASCKFVHQNPTL